MSTRIRVTLNPGTALTEYLMRFATNKERSFELLRLAQSALVSTSTPAAQAQIEATSTTTQMSKGSASLAQKDSSSKEKRNEEKATVHQTEVEQAPISLGSALDEFLQE